MVRQWLRRASICAMTLAGLAAPLAARAQIGSERYSSIVVDARTGDVISAANPDEPRFPASLTKMMTIYMLFEALRDHRVSLDELVPVSAWAASMPPTKLGLLPATQITVEQALLGLVTKSANDAAAALGEMLGGDEDRFAQMMTLRAHALGMNHTTFRNASGLPDWGQVTTARDLVVLARHLLQDFPQYYHYFSTPSFVFHRHVVPNHQSLLRTYPGADGFKTGYTEASGYNVVTSAMRGDVRLIGVVMGASSGGQRDVHMAMLLDQGFVREGVAPVLMAQREPRFGLVGAAQAAPLTRLQAPWAATVPVPAAQPPRQPAWRPAPTHRWRPPAPRPLSAANRARVRPVVNAGAPARAPVRRATSTARHDTWGRAPG